MYLDILTLLFNNNKVILNDYVNNTTNNRKISYSDLARS